MIEQAKPEVVYVPSYSPVVSGARRPSTLIRRSSILPGYYAAGVAISFGVGLAMGAMWGGGWGYGAGWGGNNNININNNNNFNRNNIGNSATGRSRQRNWQHNPQHRGGPPTEIEAQRISLAVARAGIRLLRDRRTRVRIRVSGLEGSLGLATARAVGLAM